MAEGAAAIRSLAFRGRWRRYQELALAAFERDVGAGRRRTHVVAPPGSGKTLLGVELVARLGAPAAVLAPNTAVQAQWVEAVTHFTDEPVAAADPSAPLAVLTYQALCRLDDPALVLGAVAERRWAEERAAAIGRPVEEVEREAGAWTGAAAARRTREVARITASVKREIARAEHGALHLGGLLSPGARERVEALRAGGVRTVVLDECHHLASLWGYVVRAIVEELGDVHLVGLTATPPDALTSEEVELYRSLLGPVDFTIPTPAVVREGHLAPFQELAWFTRPLETEARWLAERDVRFRELVTALHDDAPGALSFPEWVLRRMRERKRASGEAAQLSWAAFQRRRPDLARAGVRFLASAGLDLPPGAPRGEGYREQPNLDDWLALLEDYALRCLAADPSPLAGERYEAIAAALRELGFTLTRRGIRRGVSGVDRLLTASAAKSLALAEVIASEDEARGSTLRALVLTDAERASTVAAGGLVGVLRPEAGTAVEAVRALAADLRTAPLRPLLVSGRGVRCAPEDADALLQALEAHAPAGLSGWRAVQDAAGLAQLSAQGAEWVPRAWVPLATAIFAAGATRTLVGTRALLGEGWDAPFVNCVVDLTAATTAVSVTQMRGRSLRLDPRQPNKIASNWDVVCIAPELARGDADYDRFVRKHLHLFAPTEDGAIEAGPSHVHPALTPFAPPRDAELEEINASMRRRAREHGRARERWGIGEPYLGEEHATLVVRPRRAPAALSAEPHLEPPAYPLSQRRPVAVGAAAAGAAPLLVAAAGTAGLGALALVPAAGAWATLRLARARRELQDALPLDLAACAIRDAYLGLGELAPAAAASLAVEARASGYLRVRLREASTEESERFAAALDDLLEPEAPPRYVVSRLVPGRRSAGAAFLRVLARRAPFERRWVGVPRDLARRKERAEAFAAAWARWLGPSELRFTQRSEEGRSALADAVAHAGGYETRRRRVWL